MTDYEKTWDERLKIETTGRDDINSDEYRFPYEPTPYCVLARLGDSGLIGKSDVVLDYGCGKGRVGFFLSDQKQVKTIGIEYDKRIYGEALKNQMTAGAKADFIMMRAEAYSEGMFGSGKSAMIEIYTHCFHEVVREFFLSGFVKLTPKAFIGHLLFFGDLFDKRNKSAF